MNVNRQKKINQVKELSEIFENNETFYLVDFTNMTVDQAVELRRILNENSYSFKVVKNRLALRALNEKYGEQIKEFFRGPTGVAYAPENPLGLASLIKDFSKKNNVLTVKAGVVEGHYLEKNRFSEIAELKSKKDLLSKMGFLMAYPLIKFLRTWQAPLQSLDSLLSQLKSKK
ncbi:50S ribosomal protein L10 [bacterium]|nr:50S ribosomal protein L10 [bacterium]